MRQLLLDLGAAKPQTLESFVTGQNGELVQQLHAFALRDDSAAPGDRFTYIWGEAGAGKTHLLRALAGGGQGRYIGAGDSDAAFTYTPHITLYLVDDCDQLTEETQVSAFNLFNQVRENGAWMVTAGPLPPVIRSCQLPSRLCLPCLPG